MKLYFKEMSISCFHLMLELDELDFSDLLAILHWLSRFQVHSEYLGFTEGMSVEVVSRFAEHGYFENVNTGDDHDETNKENLARYLIGQALSFIKARSYFDNPDYNDMIDNWNTKFERNFYIKMYGRVQKMAGNDLGMYERYRKTEDLTPQMDFSLQTELIREDIEEIMDLPLSQDVYSLDEDLFSRFMNVWMFVSIGWKLEDS